VEDLLAERGIVVCYFATLRPKSAQYKQRICSSQAKAIVKTPSNEGRAARQTPI
jgi:hypothetical protein